MDTEHLWRTMVNLALLWALGTHHMREAHNPGNEPGKRESELGMSNRPKSRRRLLCR